MIASDDDVIMALSQELSAADKAGAGAGATGEGALDRRSRFMTGLPKKNVQRTMRCYQHLFYCESEAFVHNPDQAAEPPAQEGRALVILGSLHYIVSKKNLDEETGSDAPAPLPE